MKYWCFDAIRKGRPKTFALKMANSPAKNHRCSTLTLALMGNWWQPLPSVTALITMFCISFKVGMDITLMHLFSSHLNCINLWNSNGCQFTHNLHLLIPFNDAKTKNVCWADLLIIQAKGTHLKRRQQFGWR